MLFWAVLTQSSSILFWKATVIPCNTIWYNAIPSNTIRWNVIPCHGMTLHRTTSLIFQKLFTGKSVFLINQFTFWNFSNVNTIKCIFAAWYCMVSHCIVLNLTVLHGIALYHCWLQRAGCISQDTYRLYLYFHLTSTGRWNLVSQLHLWEPAYSRNSWAFFCHRIIWFASIQLCFKLPLSNG